LESSNAGSSICRATEDFHPVKKIIWNRQKLLWHNLSITQLRSKLLTTICFVSLKFWAFNFYFN
jgi:hypothetical protein